MFRADFLPSSGAQDWDFYNIWYNVLLMWRAAFLSVVAWHCMVWRYLHVKISVLRSWRRTNLARNMLSWSWRSIKRLLLHLVGVPYYFTYSDDARSNTNKKNYSNLFTAFSEEEICSVLLVINSLVNWLVLHYGSVRLDVGIDSFSESVYSFGSCRYELNSVKLEDKISTTTQTIVCQTVLHHIPAELILRRNIVTTT
jgi:hypothetical protein